MKSWKCGNDLTTGDMPNSALCRRCECLSAVDVFKEVGCDKAEKTHFEHLGSFMEGLKQGYKASKNESFKAGGLSAVKLIGDFIKDNAGKTSLERL